MKALRYTVVSLFAVLALSLSLHCSERSGDSRSESPWQTGGNSHGIALSKGEKPPNIILISLDTLRGDYLNSEWMPEVYKFAKRNCLIFTNAHSNSTWTKSSHVTMLTGLLSSTHKVEHEDSLIPETIVMVQERLKEVGYHTVAFVGGGYVGRQWGFDRGFDLFDQTSFARDAENPKIGDFLERIQLPLKKAKDFLLNPDKQEQPLFLFVHTYEIHEWWCHAFPPEAKQAGLKDKNKAWDNFLLFADFENRKKVYGQSARELDKRLVAVLEAAVASPFKDELCIIITSDHGEGLGEKHGDAVHMKHSGPPYAEQIRIPLVIYGAGRGVSDRLIGLDEVTPFILWMSGIENEPIAADRKILVSEYISAKRWDTKRTVAIITPEGKYLLSRDGSLHLYKDPADSIDLLDLQHVGKETAEIGEDVKQELKALGYMN